MEWGNFFWFVIHNVCENEKFNFDEKWEILTRLAILIPCPDCSSDFLDHLNNNKKILNKNNFKLCLLIYQFHNQINDKLGKKKCSWDNYKQLVNEYLNPDNNIRFLIVLKYILINGENSLWEKLQILRLTKYFSRLEYLDDLKKINEDFNFHFDIEFIDLTIKKFLNHSHQ